MTTMRRTRGKPSGADIHVGQRIRHRRTLIGISQAKLGEMLDLTFQQVQKYEKGTNRVGAGMLWKLGEALQVPPSYFFEGLPATEGQKAGPIVADPLDGAQHDEMLDLVAWYNRIPSSEIRRSMLDLMQKIQKHGQDGS